MTCRSLSRARGKEMEEKREEIQTRIQKLYGERETYVTDRKKEMNKEDGFDDILMRAISEQAATQGFIREK